MEITDIAGDLSRADLKLEAEKVRTALTRNGSALVVRGKLNGRRANYLVGVGEYLDNPIVWIDEKSEKRIMDYMTKKELPKKIRHDSIFLMHLTRDRGLLFPYHKVALVDFRSLEEFEKAIPNGVETLRGLGYESHSKPKWNSAPNWNNETRTRLLRAIRDPKSNARAFDPRAVKILQTLYEHINVDPDQCKFFFAEYSPKPRRKFKGDEESFTKDDIEEKADNWIPRQVKKFFSLDARSSLYGGLEQTCTGLPLVRGVGISSRVDTPNGVMHIPMIDFVGKKSFYVSGRDGYPSEDHIELVKELKLQGFFVDSGNSFHFYGFNLLTVEEWHNFMLDIQDKNGADEYWPKFSLKQEYSFLRITPCKHRLTQPAVYPRSDSDYKPLWNLDAAYMTPPETRVSVPQLEPVLV